MNASLLKTVKSMSVQLIGSALLATPAVFLAGNAQAAVIWDWSFGGTEAGTFTTDGNLSDTTNNFTFKITDFAVTSSTLPSNVGATYGTERPAILALGFGSTYPETSGDQGFVWDGSQPTQFFRAGGIYTNGSNIYGDLVRYAFYADSSQKLAILMNSETDRPYVNVSPLTLTPQTPAVPEPSTILGSLALGGLGLASKRKRKAALKSAK